MKRFPMLSMRTNVLLILQRYIPAYRMVRAIYDNCVKIRFRANDLLPFLPFLTGVPRAEWTADAGMLC